MKMTVAFGAIFFATIATAAWSQTRNNPFETVDQARERHSAENYQFQQRYGTPLGGYGDRLGDPAPRGTLQPGYTSPGGYGYQPPARNNSGSYWGDQAPKRYGR